MAYTLGIILFALGILFAVCVHEAGHMGTAKAFGMKVTRYFVGFGPTLWSFRRGETEYGVKAIPLGGFVKIVGMTPQEDDVEPEDEPRAMWRFPVWKRTVVLTAGSVTHFILAAATLWVMFVVVGYPDYEHMDTAQAKVASVSSCVQTEWKLNASGTAQAACTDSDPRSPATQAGLRSGDVVTALNGVAVANFSTMRDQVKALGDQDATITYLRDGAEHTAKVHIYAVPRVKTDTQAKTYKDIGPNDLERTGLLGITPATPRATLGAVEGVTRTGHVMTTMVVQTFKSLGAMPGKIPNLFAALAGKERDPDTPVSVIGASRIGGELTEQRDWTMLLNMYALLNLFFGLFNLFPLLPMDGGHIAIAWFERARSAIYVRLGRRDPGRVDYFKLTPITLGVIAVLGVFVVLTGTVDIINPVTIGR